jgi:hypothetical protein
LALQVFTRQELIQLAHLASPSNTVESVTELIDKNMRPAFTALRQGQLYAGFESNFMGGARYQWSGNRLVALIRPSDATEHMPVTDVVQISKMVDWLKARQGVN